MSENQHLQFKIESNFYLSAENNRHYIVFDEIFKIENCSLLIYKCRHNSKFIITNKNTTESLFLSIISDMNEQNKIRIQNIKSLQKIAIRNLFTRYENYFANKNIISFMDIYGPLDFSIDLKIFNRDYFLNVIKEYMELLLLVEYTNLKYIKIR